MAAKSSGSTATASQTLEAYAFSGVDESGKAFANERFEELKHRSVWTEAIGIARYNLDADTRKAVLENVLEMLVGRKYDGSRWGQASGVEDLAKRLNSMFRKADGPFFSASERVHYDGDESYCRSVLSWDEFWRFPSHEDDILRDVGIAAQAVLVLIAACPLDVDDLFGRRALVGERELANIFGEWPEGEPNYGTLESPAIEEWVMEALR